MDAHNPPEITAQMLEENPITALCLLAFMLGVFAFIAGTITCWTVLGIQLWKKRTILPVLPWTPRVWGLADLVIAVILIVVCQTLLSVWAVNTLKIDTSQMQDGGRAPLTLAAIVSASYLIATACTILWIALRHRVGTQHFGFHRLGLLRHWLIGAVAALTCLPFIYALSAAVTLSFNAKYEHPILDAMRESGSLTSYLLAVFAAVLCAPIAEEFLFRVLIQGWLQSIPFSTLSANLLGASTHQRNDPDDSMFFHGTPQTSAQTAGFSTATSEDSLERTTPPTTADSNASLDSNSAESSSQEACEEGIPETNSKPPIWPAVLTGIFFGLAHWGYGLSFIPLMVFGTILGLLYRATQSIWPCIALHFILNASSMIALGVSILLENLTG